MLNIRDDDIRIYVLSIENSQKSKKKIADEKINWPFNLINFYACSVL